MTEISPNTMHRKSLTGDIDVSIILPVFNSEQWLEECLNSVLCQDFIGSLELSIFNDASSDNSRKILEEFASKIQNAKIKYTVNHSTSSEPKGVGFAKNCAIKNSSGRYLCFLDSDDVMHCSRITKQYSACISSSNVIVGSQFHRKPENSTPRYTDWANSLMPHQLYSQIYTAFGPTLVMPTWFCERVVFDRVGGFSEKGKNDVRPKVKKEKKIAKKSKDKIFKEAKVHQNKTSSSDILNICSVPAKSVASNCIDVSQSELQNLSSNNSECQIPNNNVTDASEHIGKGLKIVESEDACTEIEEISDTEGKNSDEASVSEYCPSEYSKDSDASLDNAGPKIGGRNENSPTSQVGMSCLYDEHLSVDTSSDDSNTHDDIKVIGTNNSKNKKFYCPYCMKQFSKLPRHLESQHSEEHEVSLMMNVKNNEEKKRRAKILCKLRNIGNHKHNCDVLRKGKGNLFVVYRPSKNEKVDAYKYVPCPTCFGYFSKRELWKYKCQLKKDKKRNERVVTTAKTLLPVPVHAGENVRKMLVCMRQDDISNIVRSDAIICEYLRRTYHSKGGHEVHRNAEIRNNAREIGRLLKELRVQKKLNSWSMKDAIDPKEYNVVIKAIRNVSGYDKDSQTFTRPELARKLGLHIKTCAIIAQSLALESGDELLVEKSKKFLLLHNINFFVEIGAEVQRCKTERRRNKCNMLPLSRDVMKLTSYLKNITQKATALISDGKSKTDITEAWVQLQQATLAQIIVFNRRREGEVSRMKVSDYLNQRDTEKASEIEESLNKIEKGLCKIFTRIEIEGKCGRTVPVLLTPSMKNSLDLLLKFRNLVGVSQENMYLFASCNNAAKYYFRGSACLRKFSLECGAQHPELLRSTKLRKHVATLTQVLNLKENELECLAKFMGHDIRIHRDYYRLPDNVQQIAKLSKIFLAMEKGKLVLSSGKSLEDVEVSLEIDENSSNEDELYEENDTARCQADHVAVHEDLEKSCSDLNSEFIPNITENVPGSSKISKIVKKRTWSKVEKDAVEKHLLTYILRGKLPGADGTPEDLLFFYEHLRKGGKLRKVEEDLLLYRYHPAATTFSVSEETIWNIRMAELESNVLSQWTSFTIWNAGKQGRKFYRSLSPQNKLKVNGFCDVDEKKLSKGVYIYEESKVLPKPRVPIVHFTKAKSPFILCVKIDMTGGNFEQNLSSLKLMEGRDYYHFS